MAPVFVTVVTVALVNTDALIVMAAVLSDDVVAVIAVLVEHIDPDDPSNMLLFWAFEWIQANPQSLWWKDAAPANMADMSVTCDTFHLERSVLKDTAPLNILAVVVKLDTSHLDMSALKDTAPLNIPNTACTFDMSHLDMSALKDFV